MGAGLSKYTRESYEKHQATLMSASQKSNYENLDETLDNSSTGPALDPRSPHVCRTPINEIMKSKYPATRTQNLTEAGSLADDRAGAVWTEKLPQCQFKYNLLDPRSPCQFIDRTPLVFDDETGLPIYVDVGSEEAADQTTESLIAVYDKPFINEDPIPDTPKLDSTRTKLDPRSPTEGVARTPIVFTDEVSDIEHLESVVQTVAKIELQNKPLERVKNPRNRAPRPLRNKAIYEDKSPRAVSTTPKRILDSATSTPKRTPLSCVANKSHLRSKSVENSAKSLTSKIRVSSYDDHNLKVQRNLCENGENAQVVNARRLNV